MNWACAQPRRVISAVYAFNRPKAISDVAIDSDGMIPVVSSSCTLNTGLEFFNLVYVPEVSNKRCCQALWPWPRKGKWWY